MHGIRDESIDRSIKLRVIPLHGGYNYREDSKEKTTRGEEVAARNEGSSTAVSGKVGKRERDGERGPSSNPIASLWILRPVFVPEFSSLRN